MKWFSILATALVATVSANPLVKRAAVNPSVNANAISLSPSGGGTYPRLTTLRDGSILAGFTAFSGTTHILTVTRSTDGGKTFSAWGTVASGTGDLDNIHLIQLPNGNIVATFRNHDKNSSGAYTFYRYGSKYLTDRWAGSSLLSAVSLIESLLASPPIMARPGPSSPRLIRGLRMASMDCGRVLFRPFDA